jgi:hypothetical protein
LLVQRAEATLQCLGADSQGPSGSERCIEAGPSPEGFSGERGEWTSHQTFSVRLKRSERGLIVRLERLGIACVVEGDVVAK